MTTITIASPAAMQLSLPGRLGFDCQHVESRPPEFDALSAPEAFTLWQSILRTLDGLGPDILGEGAGVGPMHYALARLEAIILTCQPKSIRDAHAILAQTERDRQVYELTAQQEAARSRAMAFLAVVTGE